MHETHRGQQALPTSLTAQYADGILPVTWRAPDDEAVISTIALRNRWTNLLPGLLGLVGYSRDRNIPDKAVKNNSRRRANSPAGKPLRKPVVLSLCRREGRQQSRPRPHRYASSCVRRGRLTMCPRSHEPSPALPLGSEPGMRESSKRPPRRSAWLACAPAMPVFEPLHGSERFKIAQRRFGCRTTPPSPRPRSIQCAGQRFRLRHVFSSHPFRVVPRARQHAAGVS